MGGKVSIVARYKNGETIAFKTNTRFYDVNLNTPDILDEDWLKSKIVEFDFLRDDHLPEDDIEEYDNAKSIKAPFDYGIILIDYKNNTLLNSNNYNEMLKAGTSSLLYDYYRAFEYDFKILFNSQGTKEIIDLKTKRFEDFYITHFLTHAINNNALIKQNNKEIIHNGTIESVIESIYGILLKGLTKEEKIDVMKQRDSINEMKEWSDYCNMSFEYPNWKINNNDDSGVKEILAYVINNGFNLTTYEKNRWETFIERTKDKKSEDEE